MTHSITCEVSTVQGTVIQLDFNEVKSLTLKSIPSDTSTPLKVSIYSDAIYYEIPGFGEVCINNPKDAFFAMYQLSASYDILCI